MWPALSALQATRVPDWRVSMQLQNNFTRKKRHFKRSVEAFIAYEPASCWCDSKVNQKNGVKWKEKRKHVFLGIMLSSCLDLSCYCVIPNLHGIEKILISLGEFGALFTDF